MKNILGFLGAFVALVGTAKAGPTVAELMSSPPKEVRGPYNNGAGVDPQKNYTVWHIESLSTQPGESRVSYKAEVEIWSLNSGGIDFLVSGGFFTSHTGSSSNQSIYRPTQKFVDDTKPDDIAGGVWAFGFATFDADLRPPATALQVASWTWSETEELPLTPSVSPVLNRIEFALSLERSASRALKSKRPKRAVGMLSRIRQTLEAAKAEASGN